MEALREEKQLRFCPWMHTQQEGHDFAVRGYLATRGEEEENLRETQKRPELVREEPTDNSWVEVNRPWRECTMGIMNRRVRRIEQAGKAWSRGWSVDVGKGLTILPPHSQRQ